MKTLKFRCTLKSDVILNRKSASEGNNNTLDFIPGNTFLGIVAAHYADLSAEEAWKIFHSGKVRFDDAHPVAEGGTMRSLRSLRVPASWFYPKMKSIQEACYVHHFYERDKENNEKPQQLKQCREGFYTFKEDSSEATKVSVQKSFAIKSAYDREKRRSRDEQMYGYESLDAGMQFLFKVEVDEDELAETIKSRLKGNKHIGRSRTAQYGEVEIDECNFTEVPSHSGSVTIEDNKYVTVYADSRLLFFDQEGEFTLQPTADDFGIKGGEIDWGKSQVRTFQYAPWNGKRRNWDADRMGIEKGSVFVVRLHEDSTDLDLQSTSVGVYRNEGFGSVIYNPAFLDVKPNTNGKARTKCVPPTTERPSEANGSSKHDSSLLKHLVNKKRHEAQIRIYEKVNTFVEEKSNQFTGESFASQWGEIRRIAIQMKVADKIKEALFDDDNGYLMHGVAKEQWDKSKRRDSLKEFVTECKEELCKALVNLCSEMAKKCKKKGGNDE